MVLAWITEEVDHAVTGLIGCFLFWALGVVRFDVAFSGFANDTPWFLFGATLMGVVASKSGIARRLAYHVMLRVGATYPRILLGLIVTDFLLTLVYRRYCPHRDHGSDSARVGGSVPAAAGEQRRTRNVSYYYLHCGALR